MVVNATMAVADWASQCRLGKMECFRLRVALAEALNNIILHGCRGQTNHQPISIVCRNNSRKLSISVSQKSAKPTKLPLEADIPNPLSVSGRGLPIMFQWLDEVTSVYKDGRNILTLVKFR